MLQNLSPLRYPGGRAIIYNKIVALFEHNGFKDITYVEPFAGGFGIGIALLHNNKVKDVVLNDYDIHIYHFWNAVLYQTDSLIDRIKTTPITIEERTKQKENYNSKESSPIEDGFATLFLNRVNFSGIIKAGPIGGAEQKGKYLLDCRFNKEEIIDRIREIAKYRDRIQLLRMDAKELLKNLSKNTEKNYFLYIDPPYVKKGSVLYTEFYKTKDHYEFADAVKQYLNDIPWVMTYDKCELIAQLYEENGPKEYQTPYKAKNKGLNDEYVITNLNEKQFIW